MAVRITSHATKIDSTKGLGIRSTFELTVPLKLRKNLSLGDYFRVEQVGAEFVLRPVDAIDPSQAWFWTREWQQKEQEAQEDIRAGRIAGPFQTVKEFMRGIKR